MDETGFDNDNLGEESVSQIAASDSERAFTLARRIAAQLAGCSPERRALILRRAQVLWDEAPASTRTGAAGVEIESFMEVTSGWLAAVLNELPPLPRIEVLQLLSQLEENARFDRLAMGVQLVSGE